MKLVQIHTLEEEPGPGSVLLTQGAEGTAWQLFGSDGLWHSVTGRTATWAELIAESRVRSVQKKSVSFLVYQLEPFE